MSHMTLSMSHMMLMMSHMTLSMSHMMLMMSHMMLTTQVFATRTNSSWCSNLMPFLFSWFDQRMIGKFYLLLKSWENMKRYIILNILIYYLNDALEVVLVSYKKLYCHNNMLAKLGYAIAIAISETINHSPTHSLSHIKSFLPIKS